MRLQAYTDAFRTLRSSVEIDAAIVGGVDRDGPLAVRMVREGQSESVHAVLARLRLVGSAEVRKATTTAVTAWLWSADVNGDHWHSDWESLVSLLERLEQAMLGDLQLSNL
jgi:hypothetical protein